MSYQRCNSIDTGDRCRVDASRHKHNLIGMPIHKYWNNHGTRTWTEKPSFKAIFGEPNFIDSWRGWVAPALGFGILIALIVIGNSIPAANPSNWNKSDQESSITCSLGGLTPEQLAREYASCVYVVTSDIESWH